MSVGHCHPDVVDVARRQNEMLQHSTTIYLHPNIAEYAEKLAAKMPGELKVCYFTNSGSEANDLALLIARAYTGNYDIISFRNAYHGGSALDDGNNRASRPGSLMSRTVSVFITQSRPIPTRTWGRDDADAGKKYAADVKNLIDFATPGQVAAFIAESIQGVGGCVVFPDNYFKYAYEHVRSAGGVCIADEVQAGFGRTGTHYWGFETQGCDSRHRDDGQRNRKRLSARRGGDDAENCGRRWRNESTSTPSAAIRSCARKAAPCLT